LITEPSCHTPGGRVNSPHVAFCTWGVLASGGRKAQRSGLDRTHVWLYVQGVQQELWIPGVFPSLNDLIEAAKNEIRQASYSRMKRAQTTRVALRASRLVPMSSAHVTLHHHRTNKRTDPDNIVAAAQKFVLDGLQRADVLPGDGWAAVLSLTNVFLVDKDNPGTLVVLVGVKAEHGIE